MDRCQRMCRRSAVSRTRSTRSVQSGGSVVITMTVIQLLLALESCTANMIHIAEDLCKSTSCNVWDYETVYPGSVFTLYPPTTSPCCKSCYCDDEVCYMYGGFCNRTESVLSEQFVKLSSTRFTCEQLQLRPAGVYYPSHTNNIYVNKSCPYSYYTMSQADFSMSQNIHKCEHADEYVDLETRIPVSDRRTGLTYGNRFCAQCHDIPEDAIVFWYPKIKCIKEAFWPSNYDTIVTDIQRTVGCNILFEKPAEIGLIAPACEISSIDVCNIDIHAVCFADPSDVVCNIAPVYAPGGPYACPRLIPADFSFLSSFALLFVYNSVEETPALHGTAVLESVCGPYTYYDRYKDRCRKLTCLPPRILQDGLCQNTVQQFSSVVIQIFIKLAPLQTPFTTLTHDVTTTAVVQFGEELMRNVSIESYTLELFATSANSSVSPYFVLHISVSISYLVEVSALFIDTLLKVGGKTIAVAEYQFVTEIIQLNALKYTPSEMYNAFDNEMLNLYDFKLGNWSKATSFAPTITLLSTSMCTLVTLYVEEFEIQNLTWGVRISDLNANVSNWNVLLSQNNSAELVSIKICTDLYDTLIQPFIDSSTPAVNNASIYIRMPNSALDVGILSFVCTCISVLCSLLTVLTYSLFKEMRTQPGANNIALCINLIIAQVMFQFGVGQKDSIPDWACTVLGILIHFFWLNTVMWMNVCCIYSFEVFRTINKHRDHRISARRTGMYVIYTTVFATLPVAVNSVTNIINDDGDTWYGKTLCYISNNKMILLTFALPLGIVICINIILFIIIVTKLSKSVNGNPLSGKQRQFVGVYVRLSVLTGFLWTVGFLYMFKSERWIEYIFIVVNASQGLFIFASFVCNKTCARKYLRLINGNPTSDTLTTRVGNYSIRQT